MSRHTDDKNLFEIFADGIRRDASVSAPAAPGAASPASHWLGMGVLALAALSILGIVTAGRDPENASESAAPSAMTGMGMILGTVAIATAALVGMNRPAPARRLPAPAP